MVNSEVIIPSAGIADALNYAANHDLKAAFYVGMDEQPGNTGTHLATLFGQHVGDTSINRWTAVYAKTFHRAGFATAESGVGRNGRDSLFFTAARQDDALPVIGGMFRWSEKYDLPLVTSLSTTASKSDNHAPLNTIQILDGLLKGLAISEMNLPGYVLHGEVGKSAHNTRLESLVETGFVIAEPPDPVTYRLLKPAYRGAKPFENLHPTRQAAYKTFSFVHDKDADREWTADELTLMALKEGFIDDETVSDFRQILTVAVSDKTPRAFPGAVEKRNIQRYNNYSLNAQYVEAVAALVEEVAMLDTSAGYRVDAAEDARAMYRDDTTIARITQRGIQHSPYTWQGRARKAAANT